MNWGTKIVFAFVLFAGFILFMVVRAFQEDFDLVAEDYYAQELNYQSKMKQKANLGELNKKFTLRLDNKEVILSFPDDNQLKGEIHFYHISRKIFDKKFPLELDAQNQQSFSKEELVAGRYRANITWTANGKEYFQQEKIFIQ